MREKREREKGLGVAVANGSLSCGGGKWFFEPWRWRRFGRLSGKGEENLRGEEFGTRK